MMTMKELFCLVNSFMNRNKSAEENREIELPIEAAEDTRVLPGSNPSSTANKSTTTKKRALLASLEPYQHLLPDLYGMDISLQRKLQKALYSAGVSATLSLHKLLQEGPKTRNSENPDEYFQDDIDGREILERLSKSVVQEDPTKTFRLMSQNIEEIMQKMDGGKMLMNMISNELAAASLAAFASVTLRKPLTKQVESMMRPSQETGISMMDEESESSQSSTIPQELKRSASVGKEQIAANDSAGATNKDGKQRHSSSSCTRTCPNGDDNIALEKPGDIPPVAAMALANSLAIDSDDEDVDEVSAIDTDEPVEDEMEDEDSLFRYVCAAGYEDLAKLLISMRNSAEFTQQCDSTPLMEACCGGHADVVKTLILAGADVNSLSSTKNTALIYACASGHVECVKELIASGRCDLNLRNDSGHDALMEAANTGNVEIMKLLVEHGAKPTCVIDTVEYKESALTLASYKGHYQVVEYLLSLLPEERSVQEEEELHTALMEAAMDGHVDIAKLLVHAGAKVNLTTDSFENPLTLASCGGYIEMVKFLCEAGADLEKPNDEGYTPLMEASREGHFEIVEYLLEKSANVNARVEEGLETSLTLAASGGFKTVLELLVNNGGDLTIGERSPLYEACQEGHVEVARFILGRLRNSSSLAEIQKDLNEALLCAAGIDSVDLCNLLIESGAQIDCFSKDNRTPLMEASKQNCLNVVELLIKKGADVNKIAPSSSKDIDPTTGAPKKNSKKLTQKDCCPTLKCPCCIPPSLQKSAKEVCTAAGIPPAPYSTSGGASSNAPFGGVTQTAATGKRPAAPSRSSTPSAHKCPLTKSTKTSANQAVPVSNKTDTLSNSSSSATLSDPSGWMDNTMSCETQNNDTALTLACVGGHTGLVSFLLKKGAFIEHRDRKGFTPLILAATGGHTDICRLLIESSAQVDAQAERTKDTALSMACSGGRKDVAELLLKHGANKEHRNLSDYTPLSLAASGGYVDIVQVLLRNGAEINSRTNSKLGISPLMLAAMNGHVEATRILLENGSDINAQIETNKNTALTLACFQGRAEVTRLLIQYGANVEHRAKTGLTPLMEAANGGYVEVGSVLLEENSDVNSSPVPTSRDTALTIAADKGHYAFVDLLLGYDAQLNARNKKGCTALWLACNGGHLETVKVLVKKKADTEAQDNRKLTPLMIAFRKGHHKVVKYLIDHVAQFPSDGDCQRFILAQTDEDLITKCSLSLKHIKEAKEKQAEQANKAAASLLEMLAQEEALEESRKRTKQRQKEKKKAKKQAKKVESPIKSTTDDAMTAETNGEGESLAGDIVAQEYEAAQEMVAAKEEKRLPTTSSTQNKGEKKKEQKKNGPTAPNEKQKQKEQTSKSGVSSHQQSKKEKLLSSRQQNAANNAVTKTVPSTNHVKKATANGNSRTSEEEAEWLRASKKRASIIKSTAETKQPAAPTQSTPKVGTAASTPLSTSTTPSQSQTTTIPPLFNADNAISNDQLGRRPSLKVLNIAANEIPRVIGRAGCNVNAIREVTGAHVEVEKQNLDKEQTIRKITIKGPPDAVRSAIKMVDLLTKDHNLTMEEILERVMAGSTVGRKSPSLSISSETHSGHHQPSVTKTPPSSAPSPPLTAEIRKLSIHNHPAVSTPKTATTVPSAMDQTNTPKGKAKASVDSGATPNFWHKRAEAVRERKNSKVNLAVGERPFSATQPEPKSPPNSRHAFAALATGSTTPQTLIVAPQHAPLDLLEQKQHSENFAPPDNISELAVLSKEEHQRKAPGYARPQSSSSLSTNQQNSREKMQSTANNAAIPSLFESIASRWTSNPLDLMEEIEPSSNIGTIQNSWSYLLEDRKNVGQNTTMNLHSIGLDTSNPIPTGAPPSMQKEPPKHPGLLWQNPTDYESAQGTLTASLDNSSAYFAPIKTPKPQQHSTQNLSGLQSAALTAHAAISKRQHQYNQQQSHQSQQQWQQQQNGWQMPPSFVPPQQSMEIGGVQLHHQNGPFPSSSPYQIPQAPPGFGLNGSQVAYPICGGGQHNSQQSPQPVIAYANAFPPSSTLHQQPPHLQQPNALPTSSLNNFGYHQPPLPNSASTADSPYHHHHHPHHTNSSSNPTRFPPDFHLRSPI